MAWRANKGRQLHYNRTGVRGSVTPDKVLTLDQQRQAGMVLTSREYCERAHVLRRIYSANLDKQEAVFDVAEHIIRHYTKRRPEGGEIELTFQDAEFLVWRYIQRMLEVECYEAAALIAWGPELFTPEPHCTQLVWNALKAHAKNLVMGGGSLSKSYSGAVYFGLEFMRDPEWTCIKVMSVTRSHAVTNIFAHLKSLLQSTIVPIPNLDVKSESIKVNEDEKQGIHLASIPQGDTGKGRLRGFHPVPRPVEHARFGKLSRVFLLLDEAEEIPEGVWEDVNNVLLTEESTDSHVGVFAATNPKDRNSKFGQLAEPKGGWGSVDIDIHETWEAASGWNVVRLDGAKCENVDQKRVVFPGLQTWEGFERLLKLGLDNPEYYTMARGWFPEQSAQIVIVSTASFARSKGLYVFSGPTITAAGLDPAFEGNDSMIFTLLRTGNSTGWTDLNGVFHPFATERRVIQVEQQLPLEKKDTIPAAESIRRLCRDMGVKPQWLSTDRTGNATGIHDALKSLFGPEVFGIMFSWSATDSKILDDDEETCAERYYDIITEMAWAVRKFIEADLLKLNPGINWNKLEKQSTTRHYQQQGRGILRLESKKDFKKRHNGESPDHFDSLLVGVHGIRMNVGISGLLVENPIKRRIAPASAARHGIVDELEFMDVTSD
jgi:hypothetical protein